MFASFALVVFACYFLLTALLFYIIISSIHSNAGAPSDRKHALLFSGLTLASFGHTWYWTMRFMAWSFHDFERTRSIHEKTLLLRITTWLTGTILFEQAWYVARVGPLNWWWSEQLCLFTTGAFTVFLFMHRGRVPHIWAYMLLGQMVAVSVAWSLVNVALVLIPARENDSNGGETRLPLTLTIPVLLSLLTVSVSPYTSSTTFLPNLFAMRALLVAALLPLPRIAPHGLSPRCTSFYTLVALLSIVLRVRTTLAVLSSLHITSSPFFSLEYPVDVLVALWNAPGAVYGAAWDTLHSHPAQTSVGWDVVWTSVVWLGWGMCAGGWRVRQGVMKAFPTGVVGVGAVAAMEFGRVLRGGSNVKME